MRVLWAILCETAVIDAETNLVSLINVLEEANVVGIVPKEEPKPGEIGVAPGKFVMVVMWVRSDVTKGERGFGKLTILSPEKKVLGSQEFEVNLLDFLRLRQKVQLPGLPIAGPGMYEYEIGYRSDGEWETLFSTPLRLVTE